MTTDPIVDKFYVESCPLHTEQPDTAAQAPAQVEAALKRGAHVIGFTELGPSHGPLRQQVADLCATYNYGFFAGSDDSAMAYKLSLAGGNVKTGEVDGGTPGQFIEFVEFVYHGRDVTVFALHWPSDTPANAPVRSALTQALIGAMNDASGGATGISFFVADSNPSVPMRNPDSRPRKTLEAAGIPIVWVELDTWPDGVGVTTIGRNSDDHIVHALDAYLSAPLGSDHHPGTAKYGITRPPA